MAIQQVLEGGAYVLGPAVARFESEMAAYWGMQHFIGVNSGTDALCASSPSRCFPS